MARLTIEQKWWTDPRRTFLQEKIGQVGGIEVDGVMALVWRVSQEYWGQGELVPWRVFSKFKFFQQIIDSDLAEVRTGPDVESPRCSDDVRPCSEHFVYVRGSRDFFSWIFDVREKRRLAGKKSAESRRQKTGSAVPINASNSQNSEQTPNKRRTKFNKTELSGSGSGSGSGSDSGSSKNSDPTDLVISEKSPTPVGVYVQAYEERYKHRPEVGPKQGKILKDFAKNHPNRWEELIRGYLQMPDSWATQRSHPVEVLVSKVNEIGRFLATGKVVTRKVIEHAEEMIDKAQGTLRKPRKSVEELERERADMLKEAERGVIGGRT